MISLLSRIGYGLFRMGRYLERAEHIALYTKAHYLHYLDAALSEQKEELLASLLNGTELGQPYSEKYTVLEEGKVLSCIALSEGGSFSSVRANVIKARELARGARDCITVEYWEYINCFYQAMNSYSKSRLARDGFQSFTKKVIDSSLLLKGYTESVMLRDDRWILLMMGYKLESAVQATRLLLHKLPEADSRHEYPPNNHLIAMVQSIGSYEVYKKFYQQNINRQDAIDFITFNRAFPKSIINSLTTILKISKDIGFYGKEEKDLIEVQLRELLHDFGEGQPAVAEGTEMAFLKKTLGRLQQLAETLDQESVAYIEA